MNGQPTDIQIKEIWEWCGFKSRGEDYYLGEWLYPDGISGDSLPELDLTNLFKYAIPKLINNWQLRIDYGVALYDVTLIECTDKIIHKAINTCDSDLVIALFWAIYKIIHKEK